MGLLFYLCAAFSLQFWVGSFLTCLVTNGTFSGARCWVLVWRRAGGLGLGLRRVAFACEPCCTELCCVFSNVFFHLVALARSCPAAKWRSLCFPLATTGQYTCENLPKWIIYMILSTKSEGGTCLHLTAHVSLKPLPGSAVQGLR